MLISRRSALAGGLCVLAAPAINRGRFRLFAGSAPEYSTRTIDLVRQSTVIDMLGLLTLDYRKLFNWQVKGDAFPAAEFDLLKASGVTILHPAVGFKGSDVFTSSLNDLTRWNLFLAAHSDRFMRVDGVADAVLAKALGGKSASSWDCRTPSISAPWPTWISSTTWASESRSSLTTAMPWEAVPRTPRAA